jgi:hypothetical protein
VQHATRVTNVNQQILNQRQTLLCVMILPDRSAPAKLQCRLPPRLSGRHACAQILLCLQGKMLGHLLLQTLVDAPSGGKIKNSYQEPSQEFHVPPSLEPCR